MKQTRFHASNGRFSFFLVVFLAITLSTLALRPGVTIDAYAETETWSRTYDGFQGNSIVNTSDGGLIVGGDPYLLKLDADGNVEWAKSFAVTAPQGLMQTADGGYMAIGQTQIEPGFKDYVIAKFDSGGDVEWIKSRPPMGFLNAIDQAEDGGYILSGHAFPDWPEGVGDVWVVKMDSDGNVEWDMHYGGSDWESSSGVLQTDDRGYIVAGSTSSFGSGCEVWVLKLDSAGGIEWQKAFGDDGCNGVASVAQMADGGYILGGTIEPGGSSQVWLLKLESDGEIEWQKMYASEGGNINSLGQTSDNGLLLAGYLDGDAWAAKVDSAGGIIWENSYEGFAFYSIAESPSGGIVATGETDDFEFGQEIWIIKADSFGKLDNCIRDIVNETNVSISQTSVNGVDTEGTAGDIPGDFEDLDIDINDALPQFSSQCGPAPDETLYLFEFTDEPLQGTVSPGQSVRALADTADPSVEEITFRWKSPSGNLMREVTAPISAPEDTFVPQGEEGPWIVEADFGNGKVLQKSFDLSFFVIPESPLGTIALILASMGALGGYMFIRSRKPSTNY